MSHFASRFLTGIFVACTLSSLFEDRAVAGEAGKGGPEKRASEDGNGKKARKGGPTFDRLAWLSGLIEKLKALPRPPCEGPRGCRVDIAADSPCAKPAKKQPDVLIDGVLPGVVSGTWVVAYRLMCSECYLGGAGYLSLVRVGPRASVQVLATLSLKKGDEEEIPRPIEMVSEDVDDDDRLEILLRYRTEREKQHKCTGLEDAADFLLAARPEKANIATVLHMQLTVRPRGKGTGFSTTYRFCDENEDGYPDLVLRRTEGDGGCADGARCGKKAGRGARTVQTVQRYVESTDDWTAPSFAGYALTGDDAVNCDVPLPETPFVVVAATLTGKTLNASMEKKATAFRAAGFARACLFKGGDFEGLKDDHVYIITDAMSTRAAADDAAFVLRKAGFRPFVKELFYSRAEDVTRASK